VSHRASSYDVGGRQYSRGQNLDRGRRSVLRCSSRPGSPGHVAGLGDLQGSCPGQYGPHGARKTGSDPAVLLQLRHIPGHGREPDFEYPSNGESRVATRGEDADARRLHRHGPGGTLVCRKPGHCRGQGFLRDGAAVTREPLVLLC